MKTHLLIITTAAALVGCGHGAIDRLDVHVARADTGAELLNKSYVLNPVRRTFPLTLRKTSRRPYPDTEKCRCRKARAS